MLHACVERFDMMDTIGKKLRETKRGLTLELNENIKGFLDLVDTLEKLAQLYHAWLRVSQFSILYNKISFSESLMDTIT